MPQDLFNASTQDDNFGGERVAQIGSQPVEAPQGEIYRPNTIARHIVFVDGPTRCGKSMICPILASLEGVEIERLEAILEFIGELHGLGKIDRFAAMSLLRQQADEFIYNASLSRNINLRWQDHSSLLRNPRRWRYVRRLFRKDDRTNAALLLAEPPVFQCQTHDQMAYINLHFDAWPNELRVIEVRRHPVDLIDSWWRRGWGNRFGVDPMALTVCVREGDAAIPFYARGWAKEYLAMAEADRVVRMVHGLVMANRRVYAALPEERKRRVHVVRFERFATRPDDATEEIAEFLETRTTRHTRRAVRAQNCPRDLPLAVRDAKFDRLRQRIGDASEPLLDELMSEYESEWA